MDCNNTRGFFPLKSQTLLHHSRNSLLTVALVTDKMPLACNWHWKQKICRRFHSSSPGLVSEYTMGSPQIRQAPPFVPYSSLLSPNPSYGHYYTHIMSQNNLFFPEFFADERKNQHAEIQDSIPKGGSIHGARSLSTARIIPRRQWHSPYTTDNTCLFLEQLFVAPLLNDATGVPRP